MEPCDTNFVFARFFLKQKLDKTNLLFLFIDFMMMLGPKDHNYDACGLFRASHSHNPSLASSFYQRSRRFQIDRIGEILYNKNHADKRE